MIEYCRNFSCTEHARKLKECVFNHSVDESKSRCFHVGHTFSRYSNEFGEVINNAKSRLISRHVHKVWTNFCSWPYPQTSTDGDELCAYVPFVIYSILWPVGPHVVIKHMGDGCVYREF